MQNEEKIEAFKATYDVNLSNLSKRKQNVLIDRAERLLKVSIPKYITLGKVKYPHKFEIYYKTLILLIFLVGCKKKETKPTTTTQPVATTKVWCFYQTNFGGHAFLDCAKTETEYQTKVNQYNGLQFVVEVKNNCNDCQ
jgi:hypothetical protein